MSDLFRRIAYAASDLAGSWPIFLVALAIVGTWAITGPVFGFSDTWQLVINTGTTIVTFLMVFLIQNTQNRDAKAFHAKLDELIVATGGADNKLLVAEDLSDTELAKLKSRFEKVGNGASHSKRNQTHRQSGSRNRPKTRTKRSE